jgi:hypothetical protein
MLFKNSVRTSNRTPHFTITKINWLTLFKVKMISLVRVQKQPCPYGWSLNCAAATCYREDNSSSTGQDIPRLLWQPAVHHRVYKSTVNKSESYARHFHGESLAHCPTPNAGGPSLVGCRHRLLNKPHLKLQSASGGHLVHVQR